jgi:signal recognition particle receptor subunit alpha
MLDYFCIFTKGGVLLWAMSFTTLKGDPVNALIRTCLLEDRTGESSFVYTSPTGAAYSLKWTLNNALGLVFVAVYQRALKLAYIDDLLGRVARAFAPIYRPDTLKKYPEFDDTFQRLLVSCENRVDAKGVQKLFGATAKLHHHPNHSSTTVSAKEKQSDEDGDEGGDISGDDSGDDITGAIPSIPGRASHESGTEEDDEDGDKADKDEESSGGAFNAALLTKKLGKRGQAPPGSKGGKKSTSAPSSKIKPAAKPSSGKQARRWDLLPGMIPSNASDTTQLDFTADDKVDVIKVADFQQKSLVDVEEEQEVEELVDGFGNLESTGSNGTTAPPKPQPGLLSSFVRSIGVNVIGTAALNREDIAPALAELKKKLMERNVAEEIAEKVIESVATSLEGQRLGSFTRVTRAVKEAVEAALTRILTPKRSIDILREVRAAKGRGRPYIIVFVGVNGVGKSTNLAKVAYWLLQNGQKVMIAACDTFRSGAVEQLRTHCARLNVDLYERGYEKDPAKVAFEGAKAAQRAGADVLLVDTAGRMQDNEPLMRALSNLIVLNQPDLVLFVGEALVGNDAVDQLTKFDRRLADLAPGPSPHTIDGILLTKFDTIDDKVGAALSMVYTSGAPIMFVGCGQTYVDLKRLNVKSVVHSLLK